MPLKTPNQPPDRLVFARDSFLLPRANVVIEVVPACAIAGRGGIGGRSRGKGRAAARAPQGTFYHRLAPPIRR